MESTPAAWHSALKADMHGKTWGIDTSTLCQLMFNIVNLRRFKDQHSEHYTFRDVAQLVARSLWEREVAGSNPVIPTNMPP